MPKIKGVAVQYKTSSIVCCNSASWVLRFLLKKTFRKFFDRFVSIADLRAILVRCIVNFKAPINKQFARNLDLAGRARAARRLSVRRKF